MPYAYGGPYSDDPTNPTDSYVVSSYPANERTSRTLLNARWDEEHDQTNGRHKFTRGTLAQRASFTPVNDGSIFIGSDMISIYDSSAAKWLEFGVMRTGDFKMTAYDPSSPPEGFLACNGASVLRATYADLFAKIGTSFGSVDGTHFSLPDLRGNVPLGYNPGGDGAGDYGTIGGTYGAKTVALDSAKVPAVVAHAGESGVSTGPTVAKGTGSGVTVSDGHTHPINHGHALSGTPGAAHENRQPSLVVGFLVKT